jgi:WD40 repeat protein
MSWSPDGESLAVGLGDNTVRLLSRDCKNERTLNGHTEPVSSVSWSRDGRLATASTQDRTVRLWNKEGTLLDTFHILTILGGVEWRPDGQVLATIDQYGLVRLWKDNPLLKTFAVPEHAGDTDAALSPDGHILASASGNLWWQDRDHWWPSEPASPPLKNVRSVSWSPPDGRLLASTSGDAVTVWNRDGTSKQTLQYDKHRTGLFRDVKNGVITVSWHPKGNAVATGDGEGNITLWDSNKGSILGQTSCNDWAQTISWNPVNDRLLAVGCHHKAGAYMLKWNPDKKKLHKKQLLPEVNILGVSWSRDGQILATSGNNRINLWRSDGTPIREVDTGDEVGGVAWSPDGTILAVASGNAVKLFKAVKSSEQDDLPITVLKGRAGVVKSVTWNKQTLVSSSDDGTVKLWQIGEGFADNLLEKLVGLSCNWLEGYFEEKNSWVSKEDSDLQDLCRNATLLPPDNEKALPALKPAQSPAAHEETKQNSVH